MNAKLIILILIGGLSPMYAAPVADPVKAMAQSGATLYEWKVDINHDGHTDILIGYKPTPQDVADARENLGALFVASSVGFDVFIHSSTKGYDKSGYTMLPDGRKEPGGISVDVAKCYVGFVEELKSYGIVSVDLFEAAPPGGRGLNIRKRRVNCYTIEGDHMKLTNLTAPFGLNEANPIYDKYLSETKRSKVELKEIPSEKAQ